MSLILSRPRQSNDYVRIEIESALKRDIRVIPVLVDGAHMPTPDELPDSLKPLSSRNAVFLSHHHFVSEVDELARVLEYNDDHKDTGSSLADDLFAFEGRLSRRSYLIYNLLTLALLFVVVFMLLLCNWILRIQEIS
jgi:hypothetical protein